MTTLWRINLKPGSSAGIDAAEFCIGRQIVGIGWAVDQAPTSREDYWSLGKKRYFQVYKRKWSAAARAILYGMADGDLVWTRNRKGHYYLGRIRGDWAYRDATEYKQADIINLRECDWASVGTMDNVPGAVISSFIPSRTVQKVSRASALLYSRFLFAKLKGLPFEEDKDGHRPDILELLSAEDLEDVVAVYLQLQHRLIMYPSTCKSDTMTVECLFTTIEGGQKIGVQVKSGSTPIKHDTYDTFGGTVYLFAASGRYLGQPRPNCVCLQPDEMRAFIFQNAALMPGRIQRWIEFVQGR